MATAPRVANKRLGNNVIAGLEDIKALAQRSRDAVVEAAKFAKKHHDSNTLAVLVEIQSNLAEIERLAYMARQGRYDG